MSSKAGILCSLCALTFFSLFHIWPLKKAFIQVMCASTLLSKQCMTDKVFGDTLLLIIYWTKVVLRVANRELTFFMLYSLLNLHSLYKAVRLLYGLLSWSGQALLKDQVSWYGFAKSIRVRCSTFGAKGRSSFSLLAFLALCMQKCIYPSEARPYSAEGLSSLAFDKG